MLVLAVPHLLGAEQLAVEVLAVLRLFLARPEDDGQALPVPNVLLAGKRRRRRAGPAKDLARDGRRVAGVEPPVVDIDPSLVAHDVGVDRAAPVPAGRRSGCVVDDQVVEVLVDLRGVDDRVARNRPRRPSGTSSRAGSRGRPRCRGERAARSIDAQGVERRFVAASGPARQRSSSARAMPCTRSAMARTRPGRGTPRTSRRCSRAAPARCRCWRSPSRGGCAARASAAPSGRPAAAGVDRQADDAARRLAHECLARREERRVRPAVAERHAKALRVADDGVGAHLAGRRQQRQREQVARDGHQHAGRVRPLDRSAADRTTSPRSSGYCSSRPKAWSMLVRGRRRIADLEPDAERLGAAAQHVDRLREAAIRDEEHALLPRRRLLRLQPVEHRHRLGRGGAFVEQRRRRDVHPGQVLDDRLEVEQRLEAALRDFGLVRRVGRVPAGVLEHVAQDDRSA